MNLQRKEISNEIESIINKSKSDLEEVEQIMKRIKKDAFAEYRRQFKPHATSETYESE